MALPKLNTAKYTTVIPSNGKEVEFRPYLVKEEKILMIAAETNDQKAILRAVKDVINTCYDEMDINKLAMFDVEYLFLQLRAKSVGETMNVRVKCNCDEECTALTDVEINVDDIEMTANDVNNEIELTKDVGVVLNYPSMQTVEKSNPEGGVDEMMNVIVDSIQSIYDSEDVYNKDHYSKKELKEFVENLNAQQFAKIAEFYKSLPQLIHEVKFNCIKCEKPNTVELRGLASFFT